MELGKFMYQLYNNKLPVVFTECFNKIKNVHHQLTRQSKNLTYFPPRVNKSIGHLLLGFRGIPLNLALKIDNGFSSKNNSNVV